MDDYLALLREADEKARLERERREAARHARSVAVKEYNVTWDAVCAALRAGDSNPDSVPDLFPFFELAKLFKSRGWDGWLPEMAANFAPILDDHYSYRPAQLFFVQLLMIAGKPEATIDELSAAYQSFVPANPPSSWRERGARDVEDFLSNRIENAAAEKERREKELAQQAREIRVETLKTVAKRRPSIEKQLFAVYWFEQGLSAALIRDKWNGSRPRDPISGGTPGREDIKKAAQRGREFLGEQETTATELASILGVNLG